MTGASTRRSNRKQEYQQSERVVFSLVSFAVDVVRFDERHETLNEIRCAPPRSNGARSGRELEQCASKTGRLSEDAVRYILVSARHASIGIYAFGIAARASDGRSSQTLSHSFARCHTRRAGRVGPEEEEEEEAVNSSPPSRAALETRL